MFMLQDVNNYETTRSFCSSNDTEIINTVQHRVVLQLQRKYMAYACYLFPLRDVFCLFLS